ncbi:hypothetical protein D3C84_1064010 [compost metagenome]
MPHCLKETVHTKGCVQTPLVVIVKKLAPQASINHAEDALNYGSINQNKFLLDNGDYM